MKLTKIISFLIKLQASGLLTKFLRTPFCRTPLEDCFCKLLSESECNKTLEEGHCNTNRNKFERERESYENIQTLNYTYMQHLEIIFGTLQLATKLIYPYVQLAMIH